MSNSLASQSLMSNSLASKTLASFFKKVIFFFAKV